MTYSMGGPLSEKERSVAALLVLGLCARAVASRLSISDSEVETAVVSLKSHYGARSRRHLLAVLRSGRDDPLSFVSALKSNPRQWWQV